MADARSPFSGWQQQKQHAAEMQGYANALKAAYKPEELPTNFEALLDELAARDDEPPR